MSPTVGTTSAGESALELATSNYPIRNVGMLRQELSVRNFSYAALSRLPHVMSYGKTPVVFYQQSECGRHHGNFIPGSYRAILKRPEWQRRLRKVHAQQNHSLPKGNCVWRELDSSMSSDALLMNIFCYPQVTESRNVALLLGTDAGDIPTFGFMPRVPLMRDIIERTEVDMKLGKVLFEAKLTETGFQTQNPEIVEQYRDLDEVFDRRKLPRRGDKYVSYQLLRNVLAAFALDLDFCVLLDARRPDLIEQWYRIMRCIRSTILQTRCKVLTWQELSKYVPPALAAFLNVKYGIVHREPNLQLTHSTSPKLY